LAVWSSAMRFWSRAMPHSAGSTHFVNISANSERNSKIFYSMNQGPSWDRLIKNTRGKKISCHCPFKLKYSVTIKHMCIIALIINMKLKSNSGQPWPNYLMSQKYQTQIELETS
jgi:hypothetical protein